LYVLLGIGVVGIFGFLLFPSLRFRLQPSQSVSIVPPVAGVARAAGTVPVPVDLQIVTVLPRDAIPAILEPRFVTAEEADAWTDPNVQVLGVSINGEHKAYPLPVLSRHEVVNDVVGGEPIMVTW
jgi:hypothetical protein